MKIKYKDYEGKAKTNSLAGIVIERANEISSPFDCSAKSTANTSINFAGKLVELLYKKGLLNDKDIADLVSDVNYCDESSIKIIEAT